MANVHKKITIHAPIDKVFAHMTDPRNLPEIWPSMVEVKNVRPGTHGGFNFDWVYKMGGMHFNGSSDTTEFVHNKHQVTKSTKGIESKFTWDYETIKDGTQLTLEVEYKVPVPLVGKIAEAVLAKQNEHEANLMLENLKNKMEIETPVHA
jgi:uncharacterized membrane protein